MHTIEELHQLLSINRDNLDDDIVQQPQLFDEVADLYAEAIKNRDIAKQILEQGSADLAKNYRSNTPNKVTAAEVEEHVNSHPQYVAQYQAYLGYKSQAERLAGLKEAFADRSRSLRDLVSLHTTGYWGSGINVDEALQRKYAEQYRNRK